MKLRLTYVISLCCLAAILIAAADPGIEGTWVTDGVAVYEAAKAGGKSLNNLPEAVTIKFKVDAKKNKVSGTITQMITSMVYDIEDGKVKDKTFTFNSAESGNFKATPVPWKGELTDSNTVTLTRLSASGQPVGNPLALHRATK